MRIGAGVFEIFTFAVPVVHGTYLPVLDSDTHWIHGGYKEFPPELGNESKYPTCGIIDFYGQLCGETGGSLKVQTEQSCFPSGAAYDTPARKRLVR